MLHTKDSVLVVVGNNPIYFLKACDHIQGRHISNFIVMDVVDVGKGLNRPLPTSSYYYWCARCNQKVLLIFPQSVNKSNLLKL